jgi:type I restriction enzyme S subunit
MNNIDGSKLSLTDEEITLIQKNITIILNDSPKKVYIYGSRVLGKAKQYSDIDLAFDLGRKMSMEELADLREAFDNSDLRYKVDITDLRNVDLMFRDSILKQGLLIIN